MEYVPRSKLACSVLTKIKLFQSLNVFSTKLALRVPYTTAIPISSDLYTRSTAFITYSISFITLNSIKQITNLPSLLKFNGNVGLGIIDIKSLTSFNRGCINLIDFVF